MNILVQRKSSKTRNCRRYWRRPNPIATTIGTNTKCDRGAICQRLKAMGKIQMYGKWVPHQLNDRQMENRKTICKMLLQRFERKSFLHPIVTGEEKWIYCENPKRKKSWLSPGEVGQSTSRPNRFGRKTMLCMHEKWYISCICC